MKHTKQITWGRNAQLEEREVVATTTIIIRIGK